MTARVLVAGIGNVFLGDDGFGVAVAERMAGVALPEGARVVDYGIRGVHLALDLLDGWDALVLVDALQVGEEPGTVVVFEPDRASDLDDEIEPTMEAHAMNPTAVLRMIGGMGGTIDEVVVVGCEPASIEESMGLTPVVAAAVDAAVAAVLDVLAGLCAADQDQKETA